MVTLVSRKDYKFGKGKEVEPGTYELSEGTHGEKSVLHHFFDKNEVDQLFGNLGIIEIEQIMQKVPGGDNYHWYIVLQKTKTRS